jgi:predicted lipoprotein with Yx(FWY)xxD motif
MRLSSVSSRYQRKSAISLAGHWTIVARADGSKQWAYDGKPFYLWMNDKKPGDVTGDGVNGFHLAK